VGATLYRRVSGARFHSSNIPYHAVLSAPPQLESQLKLD